MTNDRRLWEYRWVRDLFCILVVLLLLYTAYTVRVVTLPIIIGLTLAYAFDPLVSWAKQRLGLPRWLTTLLLMLGVAAVIATALLYILPGLIDQTIELAHRLPEYVHVLLKRSGINWRALGLPSPYSAPTTSPEATTEPAYLTLRSLEGLDLSKLAALAVNSLGIGLGLVSITLGVTAYLLLALVLVVVCFFYFSWKFDHLVAWFGQFIPTHNRRRVLEVVRMMDRSISSFFRGRVVQATVVGMVLSVGWWAVGVPYWLLLGVMGGVLHLIPYGAIVAWPLAVALTWVNSASGGGFNPWHVLFWPTLVYLVAQGLDGWAVEPLVQSKATDLDPLSVMLAVLIGGALAGPLGMMVAVPTAACGKILAREVVLPRIIKSTESRKAG